MAFTRKQATDLCTAVMATTTPVEAANVIRDVVDGLPAGRWAEDGEDEETGDTTFRFIENGWRDYLLKLANGIESGDPAFTVFTKGNSKLPFYSWSTLPGFTCPGAGECLRFCYSFKAWQYPKSFCRQIQNTLLLRWNKRAILQAWNRLPQNSPVRLYVDGDIDSRQTLAFWCRALSLRPDVNAYGYSKSWEVFDTWSADGLTIPPNYLVNLSSGSRYDDDDLKYRLLSRDYVRGQFVAVNSAKSFAKGYDRFEDPAYHAKTRETAREQYGTPNAFSCTGKCGDCLPNGQHACGSRTMQNVLIAIGEH